MSKIFVDQVDPKIATTLTLGTSGDTVDVPSGVTLDISASTLTPPATMPASSGVNLTALNASNLGSGTVPTARLGSGTASSSTVLYGDQTYKAEPGLTGWTTGGTSNSLIPSATDQGVYLGVSSATAANLLDDYEFGTWTPTLTGSTGSAGSYATSTASGTYTKIGRFFSFTIRLVVTNIGSWTGNMQLTGLPFTLSNVAVTQFGRTDFQSVTDNCGAYVSSGGTTMYFRNGSSLGTIMTYSQITTNDYMYASGFGDVD